MNKNYITVLLEYDENQQAPAFHAGMTALGGNVMGVAFDDLLERQERLEDALMNNNIKVPD